jgi:hypothetical protein
MQGIFHSDEIHVALGSQVISTIAERLAADFIEKRGEELLGELRDGEPEIKDHLRKVVLDKLADLIIADFAKYNVEGHDDG